MTQWVKPLTLKPECNLKPSWSKETDSLSSDFHTYAMTPLSSILNFFVLKEQKRIYLGRQLGPFFLVSSVTFEELSHKDRTVGKELVRKPARVSLAHPLVGNVIVLCESAVAASC